MKKVCKTGPFWTNLWPSPKWCLEFLAADIDKSVGFEDGVHYVGHAPLKAICLTQRFVCLVHEEGKRRIFSHGTVVAFCKRTKFLQFYPPTRSQVA